MAAVSNGFDEMSRAQLKAEVEKIGMEIRQLKTDKADPSVVKEKVARMLEMKAILGEDGKVSVKCPKGTRDYSPKEMAVRELVLGCVVKCFKRHGAETMDTPVFELKEILLGKYGEEGNKLVYDLADQGGEQLSLRYDLTVPFARYLAMNKIKNIKRYHIAKVYRRDQPVMTKGRFREFYQCDFDIAGQYDPLIPEAECLKVIDEVLTSIGLGDFDTKLNHRLLLDGMFEVSGIRADQFKTVCSSVDKLDKTFWDDVRRELIDEKKIDPNVVDELAKYVRIRELLGGNPSNDELLAALRADERLAGNKHASTALDEIEQLLKYAKLFGVDSRVVVDPALARGLDYYTGVIYECVVKDFARHSCEPMNGGDAGQEERMHVGSVAAGGRYDKLVGMFSQKNEDVPCVGVSFGIERLFTIIQLMADQASRKVRTNETEVFVASAQKALLEERMKVCKLLWDSDIKAEMSYKSNPKLLNQLQYCENAGVPLVVIVGEQEIRQGVFKMRNVASRTETVVPKDDLVVELRKTLLQASIEQAKTDSCFKQTDN